jgi:hypothetical protein
MSKQLTLRGVSKELSRRLARLAEQRGASINTTVLEILEHATGMDARRERLARYTTISDADRNELDDAIALQRTIDPDQWT